MPEFPFNDVPVPAPLFLCATHKIPDRLWCRKRLARSPYNLPVGGDNLAGDVLPFTGRYWHLSVLSVISLSAAPFLGGGWAGDDFVHRSRFIAHPSIVEIFSMPDSFGFYRPLPHATLLVSEILFGDSPPLARAINLILHLGVILLSYWFASQLLSRRAAFLAALGFALTPKAHSSAILWASARPEIMMSAMVFGALLCWNRWQRTDQKRWLGAAGVLYVLSLLSKETAIILPLLLFLTPPVGTTPLIRRAEAACLIMALGAVPLWVRTSVGALTPVSHDQHYAWEMSVHRLWRSLEVYLPRATPAAAGMILMVVAPVFLVWRWQPQERRAVLQGSRRWLAYGIAWCLVFLAPVLLIPARSELYLYLPSFGPCLCAAVMVDRLFAMRSHQRTPRVLLAVFGAVFLGYQIARHIESRRIARFTAALVEAIRPSSWLRAQSGEVVVVPADTVTEQLLRDGVWGYMDAVVHITLDNPSVHVTVQYADGRRVLGARLLCSYDGRRVGLSPE